MSMNLALIAVRWANGLIRLKIWKMVPKSAHAEKPTLGFVPFATESVPLAIAKCITGYASIATARIIQTCNSPALQDNQSPRLDPSAAGFFNLQFFKKYYFGKPITFIFGNFLNSFCFASARSL